MKFKIKDPGSSITHFIGMILATIVSTPLIIRALNNPGYTHVLSLSIFIISMILLYAASTTYHTFDISQKWNTILRKIDHCAIFLLIAGSYTPICLIALEFNVGIKLFTIVWSVAIIGIILKLAWINAPAWFSSAIYILMGWICLFAIVQIVQSLPQNAFHWLLAGGIMYTIGGIIYALKLPALDKKLKNFGSHEIFHVFVLFGSACHFIMMYQYLAVMPIY